MRHAATPLLTLALALAGAVRAAPPQVDALADSFAPAGGRGFLVADDARPAPHLGVTALAVESLALDPVVLRGPDGAVVKPIVAQQATTTLAASVGLFDRLELSLRAAGAVENRAASFDGIAAGMVPALADPRLSLKILIVDAGPFALAARASVQGPGDLVAEPALLASVSLPWLRAGVDAGTEIDQSGVALRWAAGASVPLGDVFSVGADVFGAASAGDAPVEAALSAAARLGPAEVYAGAGGGLVAGVGTPRARAFAGVRFFLDPAPPPVVVVAAPTPAPAPAPPPAAAPAKVAPPAPAPKVTVAQDAITFSDDVVLFDTESDRLQRDAAPTLGEVVEALQAHPEVTRVVIEGHADARGDADYNRRLSLWRALNVRRFLVDAGVDPRRLSAVGVGRDKPRAPNDTPEGRRQNRRVELHIVGRSAP